MPEQPILLSQAHVTDLEVSMVTAAIQSGWVAPLGPDVDAFEAEFRSYVGIGHALALSSGTAALHLGLLGLGVRPGDEVIVATLTFGATAFAVTYTGARPVFLDVENEAWGLDPELLESVLADRARTGTRTAAIIPVDLYGRPANYEAILPVAQHYGVPVLVDAAESLGAHYDGRATGTMGAAGVYSFNGNKIMTTSGGGMLVSDDEALIAKARFRSTQSREAAPWYEHNEVGYNYRMSNLLAALGRAQLIRLPEMIARRQAIRARYATALGALPGVTVTADPPWGESNSWLTTITFDSSLPMGIADHVRRILGVERIESRPIWKPMHLQPVFRDHEAHLTGVADRAFEQGLCLPSGVGLSDEDVDRVVDAVTRAVGSAAEALR